MRFEERGRGFPQLLHRLFPSQLLGQERIHALEIVRPADPAAYEIAANVGAARFRQQDVFPVATPRTMFLEQGERDRPQLVTDGRRSLPIARLAPLAGNDTVSPVDLILA